MSEQLLLRKGERALNLESAEAVATLRDRTIIVVNAMTGVGEKHKTPYWREKNGLRNSLSKGIPFNQSKKNEFKKSSRLVDGKCLPLADLTLLMRE